MKLNEIDLLKLQLFIERGKRVEAEYTHAQLRLAQERQALFAHLESTYGLGAGASIDSNTGVITRTNGGGEQSDPVEATELTGD
jgi:hypothetical protein